MSGQLHVPAAFPQGKSPWYPFDRRIGGPQSRIFNEAQHDIGNMISFATVYMYLHLTKLQMYLLLYACENWCLTLRENIGSGC